MMTDDELLAFSSSLFEEDDDDDGFFGTQLSEFCESIESSDIDQFISSFEDKGQFDDLDLNFSLFDGFSSMLEADFSAPQERRRTSSNSTTIKVETKETTSRCGNRKSKQEKTMTTTTTTTKYMSGSSNTNENCNRIKKLKNKKDKKKKVAGISLLAKPPKVTKVKKSINENRICPSRFAAYFYRTHDYCSNPNKPLYQDISKNCSKSSSCSSSSPSATSSN